MKNRILKSVAAVLVCLSLVTLGGCSILEQFFGHEHDMRFVAERAATCTQDGEKEHYHCDSCEKDFEDEAGNRELESLAIPALGHDGERVDAKQATCTSGGNIEYYVCGRCHLAFADKACTKELEEGDYILPATGHKPAEGWNYDSITHYQVCESCGARMNAEAHTYGDDGSCTVCGYEQGADDVIYGNKEDISSADLSIHFIAPEVKASGDSALIKVGDTEILVDAGPTQSNVSTIKAYLNEYCTDGILEYVIATHADKDHIAGFVGNSNKGSYNGIFYSYPIETLIQFDRSNSDTNLYKNYQNAVKYLETQGTAVYTASQCWYNIDGAQRKYYLDDEQTISLNILYNHFYENESSDENNYSVCFLLTQELENGKANNYLFTGDLEEEGEEYLVQDNDLPQVELYKAGHHGSKTSSNNCLLEVIKPKNVVVCCCAGYNQYGSAEENIFPTQAFITRISRYTENVYVTIMLDKETNGYKSMNGDVVFYYDRAEWEEEGSLKLWCSNNTTKLKDTEWFKANRYWGIKEPGEQ